MCTVCEGEGEATRFRGTCIIICNVHVFLYFANMKIFVDECRGNHVSLNIFVLEDICD